MIDLKVQSSSQVLVPVVFEKIFHVIDINISINWDQRIAFICFLNY